MLNNDSAWLAHTCKVSLQGVDRVNDLHRVYPAAPLYARVRLEFEADGDLQTARVSLRYRAFGSGSPETHEIVRRTVHTGPVVAGTVIDEVLTLVLPEHAPISYEGTYVKIQWVLVMELKGNEGELHECEFPLLVTARPVSWAADLAAAPPELLEEATKKEATTRIDQSHAPTPDDATESKPEKNARQPWFRVADPAAVPPDPDPDPAP